MNFYRLAAAAAVLLAPVMAQADPRQDIVDGMAKCAVIADSIDRLSCYDALYPAVRAAQREAPSVAATPGAPPSSVAATPAPAAAAPAAVADDRPWYDPRRVFGVPPQAQTTPQQFGGENLAPPPPPPGTPRTAENTPPPSLDSITAGVTDYSFNPYDKFLVVLDNGQIWQQLESDSGKAAFHRSAKNTVTISRGFMESYNLQVNDGSAIFKVRRLK